MNIKDLNKESIIYETLAGSRVEGKDKQFLMDIRNGKFEYEDLMSRMQTLKDDLDERKVKSDLQEKVDMNAINDLYMELIDE